MRIVRDDDGTYLGIRLGFRWWIVIGRWSK